VAISPIFSIARRALQANESALSVVGNNIANVNTPGYTRQVVDLESGQPASNGLGLIIGSGVQVGGVSQVLDPLLARRLLGAGTSLAQSETYGKQLEAISAVTSSLDDPSLATALGAFFDAAGAFARNTGAVPERQTLLGRAEALASEIRRRSAALAGVQRDADDRYVAGIERAGGDVARIAALNREITISEAAGNRANELRDKRTQALEDLASLVGVSAVEKEDGSLWVAAANGAVLVDGGAVAGKPVVRDGAAGRDGRPLQQAGFEDAAGGFIPAADAFRTGAVAGLAAARDVAVETAASALDTFALALRDQVNAIQTDPAAFDLDGASTATAPLFAGTGARDLVVALSDPRRLAGALTTQPGDNQNALRLADLRSAPIAALGNISFAEHVAAEQWRVGEEASLAADRAATSTATHEQLVAQRASVSGVSLNEELANLLSFQRAFQAASRMIGVADGMLAELMETV
jgi:flagellar hook-associated protein 1 FlgK